MTDDRKGAARHIKGSIKEAIGKIIGDPAIEAEGAAEMARGKAGRNSAGPVRSTDDDEKI